MHASNFFMIQRDLSIVYDAVVPGSSIPEWFTHQSERCSVTVELPPHWCNTRLMGLAVCVVFHPNIGMGKFGRSEYFSMNESGGFSLHNTASTHFSKADHIWFGYWPLVDLFGALVVHLETRATLWRFHFLYPIVTGKAWKSVEFV